MSNDPRIERLNAAARAYADAEEDHQSLIDFLMGILPDTAKAPETPMAPKAEVLALKAVLGVFLGHFAEIIGRGESASALNDVMREKTVQAIRGAVFFRTSRRRGSLTSRRCRGS